MTVDARGCSCSTKDGLWLSQVKITVPGRLAGFMLQGKVHHPSSPQSMLQEATLSFSLRWTRCPFTYFDGFEAQLLDTCEAFVT